MVILSEDISPNWGPGDHVGMGGDVLDLNDLGDLGFPEKGPVYETKKYHFQSKTYLFLSEGAVTLANFLFLVTLTSESFRMMAGISTKGTWKKVNAFMPFLNF